MDEKILEKALKWTQPPYDDATIAEVKQMMETASDYLIEAFYKDLEFGTGGLRGITGPGTNRVNRYTIAMATQGLCNYLKQHNIENPKAAIAFDCRNNSVELAKATAEIFSANGVETYLFESLRPTPELSFAIRKLGCHTGVVITASHNPPEYNGYKVYWADGGQIVAPHDGNIIAEVRKITSLDQVNQQARPELIHPLGEDMDQHYLAALEGLFVLNDPAVAGALKIVYTPLHGTGYPLIPQALSRAGFDKVEVVESQRDPDGNFPTVVSPNPEEKEALTQALELGSQYGADIVLGTDPDADRVGIAVRNRDGDLELLNGNQAASVLIYYLLEQWKAKGKLTGKEFICKTVVTSDLLAEIASAYGVKTYETLTGFKYIADLIQSKEGVETFIGGGEESYGYLVGDVVRDKDAVISSVILCEAAAWAKLRGSDFYEMLIDIYLGFGCFRESLISVTRKGRKGADEIVSLMEILRQHPPNTLGGAEVVEIIDFAAQQKHNVQTGAKSPTNLPVSNVLQFLLIDGSKITARPSGTEPKIKFYFSLKAPLNSKEDFEKVWTELGRRTDEIVAELPIPRG